MVPAFCHRIAEIGTLRRGNVADLLIVNGNPADADQHPKRRGRKGRLGNWSVSAGSNPHALRARGDEWGIVRSRTALFPNGRSQATRLRNWTAEPARSGYCCVARFCRSMRGGRRRALAYALHVPQPHRRGLRLRTRRPWWNPAVEAQAIDRTHRVGQDRHVCMPTRSVPARRITTRSLT